MWHTKHVIAMNVDRKGSEDVQTAEAAKSSQTSETLASRQIRQSVAGGECSLLPLNLPFLI